MVLTSAEFSTDRCEADTDGIMGRLKLYYSPSTIIAIPTALKGVAMFSGEFDVQMLMRNIPVSCNFEFEIVIELEHRQSDGFRVIRIKSSTKNKYQPLSNYEYIDTLTYVDLSSNIFFEKSCHKRQFIALPGPFPLPSRVCTLRAIAQNSHLK